MTTTPERESAASPDFYGHYVCGLMAEPAVSPVEHAILRTLAVRAPMNAPGAPVRCSLPALAERVGRDVATARTERSEDDNRQVREGYKSVRARGWVDAERNGNGRGHAYHAHLPDRWERRREPAWPQALGASKCISLQVSPLGPTSERDYHELLWTLDRDGVRTGTRAEWAEFLGISTQRVLPRLSRLAGANIGVSLEELPPEPRKPGERGRKPKRYRVVAVRPPQGVFPDGAKRHRARLQQEREMVRQLTAPVEAEVPAGDVLFADDGSGGLVAVPVFHGEDEDLPDDLFDEALDTVAAHPSASEPGVGADHGDYEAQPEPQTNREKLRRATAAELHAQADQLRAQLWHPDLADELVGIAEGRLKAGNHMSAGRRINYIYRPVIELQEEAGNREVLKDALETVRDDCAALRAGGQWTRFAQKVLVRRVGAPIKEGSNAAVKQAHSPEKLAAALAARLREAYEMNRAGDDKQARVVLASLLQRAVPMVAPVLFDGDEPLARAAIVEAFKCGSSDAAPRQQSYPAANYLPESEWPHATRLSSEAQAGWAQPVSRIARRASVGRGEAADVQLALLEEPTATPESHDIAEVSEEPSVEEVLRQRFGVELEEV